MKILAKVAIIVPIFWATTAFAQLDYYFNLSEMFPLEDFTVEKVEKYKILALDKEGEVKESIEGIYKFSINGYLEDVTFVKGRAELDANFNGSAFLYVKHEREGRSSLQHLFYTVSGHSIQIPFWVVWLLPAVLLLLSIIIRKLLIWALLIALVLFFFLQGIDLQMYWQLVQDSIGRLL